jgi:hypothetical protein
MNERIKQLALRAGEYVNSVYTPPVRSKTPDKIWEDGHVDWHTQFNQKFAELIVKECISALDEKIYRSIDGDGDEIWADLILKEHFGVEE